MDDECSGGGRDTFLDYRVWSKIRLGVDYIYGKEGSLDLPIEIRQSR